MNINIGDLIGVQNYHGEIEFILITEICTKLNNTLTNHFKQQGFYCRYINLTMQELSKGNAPAFIFYDQIIEL